MTGGDTVHPISQKIHDVLKERDISNAEMARRINIGRSTFSRWFSSDIEPRATTVKMIADELDLPYSYFLDTGHKADYTLQIDGGKPIYIEVTHKPTSEIRIRHYQKMFEKILDLKDKDRDMVEDLITRLSADGNTED